MFYGHEVVKSEIFLYIENFVILKFVINKFNCISQRLKSVVASGLAKWRCL